MTQVSVTSESKPHYAVLDGLRGLAAIAVVIFHFMEWVYTDFTKNVIAHGFLAVDFFFCLSGFVIAFAYDDRVGRMGIGAFLKARFIRLHPLIVLGSVLGLLAFLFDPFASSAPAYGLLKTTGIFISSVLMVPLPIMEERAFNLFGLNAPSWSLFWEYIASLVYVLVLWHIPKKVLPVLLVVAAIALCLVCQRSGNLLGGWNNVTFWDGGARVFYSFLAGLAIYRFRLAIPNKLGFMGLGILLSLAFLMPYGKWNWLSEPLVVIVYFPLLVALGAGATAGKSFKRFCAFSGEISYPLYMTHYAVLWVFGNYFTHYKPAGGELATIIVTAVILLVGFAYLVMIGYDRPVRAYLKRKWN